MKKMLLATVLAIASVFLLQITPAGSQPYYPGLAASSLTGTVSAANGGTGVANNSAATLTRSGSHALTITTTGTTGVTLPTTGTLSTLAGSEALSNKTITASSLAGTTISASSTITPSQTVGIVGTTTNNSVQAGSVGEYIESVVSSVTVNTASVTNITSISLTAGDWDVAASFTSAGVSTQTNMRYGISQTTASFTGTTPGQSDMQAPSNVSSGVVGGSIPMLRVLLSGTTTLYFVGQAGVANLPNVNGGIYARRVR